MPTTRKAKAKVIRPLPKAPPVVKSAALEPEKKSEPNIVPDNTIYGFRPWATSYLDTVGSAGGKGFGLDLYMGKAFRDRFNILGLSFGGQYSLFTSKLPELSGKSASDSLKGLSFFVDRREFSDDSRSFSRAMGGLGVGQYCPGVGDTCWPALYTNATSSFFGYQLANEKNDFGVSLSLDLNSQTYLHLTSDENLRHYSHPSQVFGPSLSLDFRFGTPSFGGAVGEALSTREIIHEVVKYGLDDMSLFFGAQTSGDPLQKGKELLADAGQGEDTTGPITQPKATTNVGSLLALKAVSGALGHNAHLELFEKMDKDQRPAFFWGNVANTGLLFASSYAMGSDTMLQGGLSSLQHTANLIPILKEASPEASYWARFFTPHLMALGGLALSGGKRQPFLLTAAEGWIAPALHAGSSETFLDSTTYSYSMHASTQTFDKGTLKGQSSEVAIENKLKSSGLSTRAAYASPVIALSNGNAVSTLDNVATSAGIGDGKGAAYESPTLPTTVSSMVGWRGVIGDSFYGSASVFVGLALNLGPQDTPQLGATGRASVGAGFGGFTLLEKKWYIGAEGFVNGAKFSDSTLLDHGVAATLTIR